MMPVNSAAFDSTSPPGANIEAAKPSCLSLSVPTAVSTASRTPVMIGNTGSPLATEGIRAPRNMTRVSLNTLRKIGAACGCWIASAAGARNESARSSSSFGSNAANGTTLRSSSPVSLLYSASAPVTARSAIAAPMYCRSSIFSASLRTSVVFSCSIAETQASFNLPSAAFRLPASSFTFSARPSTSGPVEDWYSFNAWRVSDTAFNAFASLLNMLHPPFVAYLAGRSGPFARCGSTIFISAAGFNLPSRWKNLNFESSNNTLSMISFRMSCALCAM